MFIQVDENLREHPKTVRLRRMLMNPQAHAFLLDLWAWCCKFAQDGNLAGHDPADIEYALGWAMNDTSQTGKLFDALVKCGWIDQTDDGSYVVHDWMEHQGRWIAKMKSDRDRMREIRDRRQGRRATDHLPVETKERTPLEMAADEAAQPELPIATATVPERSRTVREPFSDGPATSQDGPGYLTKPNQTKPNQTEEKNTELCPPAASRQEGPSVVPEGPALARVMRGEEVRDVFAHYRTHHPRAFPEPKSPSQEWRKIKARLDEGYSVEDLRHAIDGYHRSPFHCGENDRGQKYLDLELIVRDGSHVARGIELYSRPSDPVLSEREKRGLRAGQMWLERHGQGGADDRG